MNKIEKTAIAIMVISVAVASAFFGVWEDKFTLYAPLLVLVYIAFTMWVVVRLRRQQRSDVRCQALEVDVPISDLRSLTSDVRRPISDLRPPTSGSRIPPGGILLLLFFFYSVILIPFSVLPYEAKISTLCLGGYLAVYWASANILSRFAYRKGVWVSLFAALVFIALYSLVQHKVAPNLIFGMERYTTYWEGGRLGGTYQCPNHIAHLFQMGLPFCLVFLFIPQFGWFWRICFAYALPLFALLIYQTQSRAGILGVVAALSTTILFMLLRKSRRAFRIALLLVPLFGAVALGGLWVGSTMFRERMQPVVKVLSSAVAGDWDRVVSVDFRPMTWADTVVMIKDRPLFGFGPGNYALTYEDYRTRVQALRIITVHAHNEYLELIAEYGLVGGLLVFGALACMVLPVIRFIKTADRSYHALPAVALLGALAGTAVHGFFDFELHNFPNALLLALLAGCSVAPMLAQQKSEIRGRRSEDRGRKTEDGDRGRKTEDGDGRQRG